MPNPRPEQAGLTDLAQLNLPPGWQNLHADPDQADIAGQLPADSPRYRALLRQHQGDDPQFIVILDNRAADPIISASPKPAGIGVTVYPKPLGRPNFLIRRRAAKSGPSHRLQTETTRINLHHPNRRE